MIAKWWARLRRGRGEKNHADKITRKSSLENLIDSLARTMHVFTVLVAVGLIIEYRTPFVRFWYTGDWGYILAAIGGILVTVGVAGELSIGLISASKEKRLRALNEELAAIADALLSRSNERVAELEASTEQLRKENLQLEAAFMNIDPSLTRVFRNQDVAISLLSQFTGLSASIEYVRGLEAESMAHQINWTLWMAYWPTSGKVVGDAFFATRGVFVTSAFDYHETSGEAIDIALLRRANAATELLIKVLNRSGIRASKGLSSHFYSKSTHYKGLPPNTILIQVGDKPEPVLDSRRGGGGAVFNFHQSKIPRVRSN